MDAAVFEVSISLSSGFSFQDNPEGIGKGWQS